MDSTLENLEETLTKFRSKVTLCNEPERMSLVANTLYSLLKKLMV